MAELLAIWLKRAARGPMGSRPSAIAVAGRGLLGNAEQGGRRQVTVLGAEAWARAEADLGCAVDPVVRRANLLVGGVDLRDSRDRVLRIGSCRILVRGELRPCRLMDDAVGGLCAALDPEWRGGVHGEVLTGGEIAVGDPVAWDLASAADLR